MPLRNNPKRRKRIWHYAWRATLQTTEVYNKSVTPVIFNHGIYWKREDHFRILGLNGSKARFIYTTLLHNRQLIVNNYDNTVAISNRPDSHSYYTQNACCKHFGFNFINYTDREQFNHSPYFKFLQNSTENALYYYDEIAYQV